jgi:single-stranded-DNA-specific exonuclease
MKSNSCVGIKTLIKATNIKNIAEINVSNFNFKIAPLINAAGRVNDANIIVDLLTTKDDIQASEIGNRLIRENKKRQFLQGIALKEALSRASLMNRETKLILLENDGWHPGVIGIIAAKIKNKFKRPAIIITFDQDGNGNGSARSLEGFNIYEILSHLKGYFDSFGGHPFAAGFTIQKNNLELFKKDLLDHVNKTKFKITEKNLILDGKLNLNDINHQFITTLNYLAPYGPENLQPRFSLEKLSIIGNPKIIGSGSHLRFQVKQNQKVIDVVGFGLAESYKYLIAGKLIDIAGFPEVNIWKGKKRFQFNAKAIRLSI